MRILAVDPGITGSGVAYRTSPEGLPVGRVIIPLAKKDTWEARTASIVEQILYDIAEAKPELIVCENMQFERSDRGEAAIRSGNIFKTQALVGALLGVAVCYHSLYGCTFETVEVNEWKGQLSKDIIIDRICRDLNCTTKQYKSHAWDSVGILMWAESHLTKC